MLNVSKLWPVVVVTITTVAAAAVFAAIDSSPTPANAGASTCSSQPFFSEYVEGTGNNKAVEIYNGTSTVLNLSDYSIELYANGGLSPITTTLSGMVAPGDVFVIAAVDLPGVLEDQIATTINFNGNDSLDLVLTAVPLIVDSIGDVSVDPGVEWGTGNLSTQDNTIQRLSTVSAGRPFPPPADFDTTLPLEWQGLVVDTLTGLGAHTADCFGAPPPTPTPIAANTGSVVTTINAVDAPGPCLLLSTDSIDYGTLAFSTSLTSRSATGEVTVTSCSPEPEDILARGADATGASATWTLTNPPPSGNMCEEEFEGGSNVFAHTLPDLPLTTTNQTYLPSLPTDVAVSAETTFRMPCSGSDGAGELISTSITFTAVASNQ